MLFSWPSKPINFHWCRRHPTKPDKRFFLKSFESIYSPWLLHFIFIVSYLCNNHNPLSPFNSFIYSFHYRCCCSISYFYLSYIIIFLESLVGQYPKPYREEQQAMAMKSVLNSAKSKSPWHLSGSADCELGFFMIHFWGARNTAKGGFLLVLRCYTSTNRYNCLFL